MMTREDFRRIEDALSAYDHARDQLKALDVPDASDMAEIVWERRYSDRSPGHNMRVVVPVGYFIDALRACLKTEIARKADELASLGVKV